MYFLLIIYTKCKLFSMFLFFTSNMLKVTVYQQYTQTKASYCLHAYITYISFLYIYLYATPSISGSSIYFFLHRNWSVQNVICYITYLSN